MVLRLWMLFLLTLASAEEGVTYGCHICKAPKVLVKPDYSLGQFITDGKHSLTCGEAEAYATGGCYDKEHCGFLKGFVEKWCCGDADNANATTIDPSRTCPETDPYTGMPGGGGGAVCFTTEGVSRHANVGKICIDSYFDIMCQATLNDQKCKGCQYWPGKWGCQFGAMQRYDLDCTNVQQNGDLRVCGEEVTLNPTFSTSSNSSSSSSDGSFIVPVIVVILMFVARFHAYTVTASSDRSSTFQSIGFRQQRHQRISGMEPTPVDRRQSGMVLTTVDLTTVATPVHVAQAPPAAAPTQDHIPIVAAEPV